MALRADKMTPGKGHTDQPSKKNRFLNPDRPCWSHRSNLNTSKWIFPQKYLPRELARLPNVLAQFEEEASAVARPLVPRLAFFCRLLLVLHPPKPLLDILRPHLGSPPVRPFLDFLVACRSSTSVGG